MPKSAPHLIVDKVRQCPAVVAWFAKASVFHSVNSAPSANGGSNPTWVINMVANAPAVYVHRRVLYGCVS